MKVFKTLTLNGQKKLQGKVRDIYVIGDKRILITTDRQSAFDVMLGHIPQKGAVLNLLSKFWFEKTKQIIQNHMVAVPDPNVMVTRNCEPIPVEMVVRGYMTGVTPTSIWPSYQKGERIIYGIKFPDGLTKNQKLPKPVITPTTHPEVGKKVHDERLTKKEILKSKLVDKKLYEKMEKISLKLFKFGQKLCEKKGLILVDTKYEFGLYNGKLILIDEVHTPDSSRFWIKKTYKKRYSLGLEPENFDKEFIRLWYRNRGYKPGKKVFRMSPKLINDVSQRYIDVYEKISGKKYKKAKYPLEKRVLKNLDPFLEKEKSITYSQVGDNYSTKDPINKLSQQSAKATGINLKKNGFEELSGTRGESAFVWKQGNIYMASVIECLGTKSLIAEDMRNVNGKTYFDVIAQDTIATFINDLSTVGAKPLVIHAYWAVEDNSWLTDRKRMTDFIIGWKKACDKAGVTWGGGETATLKGILQKNSADLAGSAVGIITSKKRLLLDTKLRDGDRIILLKSNGVNANGISLARAIAKRLKKGYGTKVDGRTYGELLLTRSNIYAKVIQALLDKSIELHYATNITGHGLRKIMRARQNFTYVLEKIFKPQEIFNFIKKHAAISDDEMYQTYNMGQDFALFLPKEDVKKALKIIKRNGFRGIDAGYVEKGERKVVIKPKNLVFKSETLDLR